MKIFIINADTVLGDFLKNLLFFILMVVLAVPFIVSDNLFFPYISSKGYLFRVLTEVAFFLWAILALKNNKYRPHGGLILYSMIFFGVATFFSNFFGMNRISSMWSNYERMEGFVTLAHLGALFIVISSIVRTKKHWLVGLNIFFATSFVSVAQSVKQIFEHGINYRLDTTLGNPIYLAAYMLFAAFVSLYLIANIDFKRLAERGRNWWQSKSLWIYVVGFVLQSLIIFQTGTRGAMLGYIGGIIILLGLLTFIKGKSLNLKLATFGAAILIIVSFFTIISLKDTSFIQNSPGLRRLSSISIHEGTAKARLINWGIAIDAFKERPVIGWGQSNYNLAFDKYYDPAMHGNETWFDRAHNVVFDWLIAGGIIGLLLYLSIFGAALYVIWRSSFSSFSFSIAESAVLTGLLAAYFFHNLFVFDNIVTYLIFFLLLAYLHSQNSKPIAMISAPIRQTTSVIISVVILILMPVTIYAVNYQSYQANRELIGGMRLAKQIINDKGEPVLNDKGEIVREYYHKGGPAQNLQYFKSAIARDTFGTPEIRERLILTTGDLLRIDDQSTTTQQIKSEFVQTAVGEMVLQIESSPQNSRYPFILGVFLAQISSFELAEKYLTQAIELSPRKQAIRFPLIRVYLQTGRQDEALALAKETYELDTSKDDVWVEYAATASIVNKQILNDLLDEAFAVNDHEKVLQLLNRNIEARPENIQGYVSLAAYFYKIGDQVKALQIIDDLIIRFPEHKVELQNLRQQVEAGELEI